MATSHLLRDSVALTVAGVVLGLAANALSPRGLSLTRDYFTPAPDGAKSLAGNASVTAPASTARAQPPAPARSKRGLPLATHEEVVRWFHDPAHDEQRILFLDARDGARYATGHIPGALPFDHYHPEHDIAAVLGAAALAERIVLYCSGGDCEDSELAALDLIALGIPSAKLVIYGGGITAWTQHGLPLETAEKASTR